MKISPIACIAALLVASPAAPLSAQKRPDKIKLTAESKDGAVLVRVPVDRFSYALQFSRNGNSGFMSRVYIMKVDEAPAPGYAYIARTLSPGRYRLDSMWQQARWSACLEQGTFEFTVRPGEIAYLGTVRADRVLETIQGQASSAGQTAQGGFSYFQSHDRTSGPPIEGRDDDGLRAARDFAQTRMNGTASLVRLADVSDTKFVTSAAGKAIKVCG